MKEIQELSYLELIASIGQTLEEGRSTALRAVNTSLVTTNWRIGQHIVEFEQHGKERATYGDNLLNRLSQDLTLAYGKGFSRSNVAQIRQFYLRFPKIQTLSGQLSWSHYTEILKAEDELAVRFYAKQCETELYQTIITQIIPPKKHSSSSRQAHPCSGRFVFHRLVFSRSCFPSVSSKEANNAHSRCRLSIAHTSLALRSAQVFFDRLSQIAGKEI